MIIDIANDNCVGGIISFYSFYIFEPPCANCTGSHMHNCFLSVHPSVCHFNKIHWMIIHISESITHKNREAHLEHNQLTWKRTDCINKFRQSWHESRNCYRCTAWVSAIPGNRWLRSGNTPGTRWPWPGTTSGVDLDQERPSSTGNDLARERPPGFPGTSGRGVPGGTSREAVPGRGVPGGTSQERC